ncbi:ABC transporter substrate-binding protein [Anaerovorax odorimutans]|uniref:ABC transporter substrate-binding protein n=1 Tax=Anaerovorax odorimutans TaxID=109327 RepID=UPI00041CE7D1|nr:ABC transporter substrate-binding protein [Anaerovorax odorimutans]
MQKHIKILALILIIVLTFSLAACSQGKEQGKTGDVAVSGNANTVEFVDGIGRTVTIPTPENLKRIYADSTNSFVLMYILAPDMITASPSKFTEDDAPYVLSDMIGLPSYGTISGSNGVLDYEAIKAGDVQLIISSVQGKASDSDIETADKLQEQLDIPVIVFSTQLEQLPDSLTLLGKALGHEKEAAKVVDYFNGIVEKVTSVVSKIPEDKRLTLYYAEAKDGLSTEPGNSNRSIVFNMCGTKNVATVEALSGFGQSAVSMESLFSWNPEIIIVQGGTGAYDIIKKSADWASISAVKKGHVYEMPNKPFGWADRPPGANRYIGLLWLADLLYPDEMGIDFVDEAIDYYKVIYHVDVTRKDIESLLVNSMPPSE